MKRRRSSFWILYRFFLLLKIVVPALCSSDLQVQNTTILSVFGMQSPTNHPFNTLVTATPKFVDFEDSTPTKSEVLKWNLTLDSLHDLENSAAPSEADILSFLYDMGLQDIETVIATTTESPRKFDSLVPDQSFIPVPIVKPPISSVTEPSFVTPLGTTTHTVIPVQPFPQEQEDFASASEYLSFYPGFRPGFSKGVPESFSPNMIQRGNADLNRILTAQHNVFPTVDQQWSQLPSLFPAIPSQKAHVREDAPLGTLVHTVGSGDVVKFPLSYGIAGGNERRQFDIDSGGRITVVAPLDRELTDAYNLSIRVVDYAGHESVISAYLEVIDVNDNAPIVGNYDTNFEVPCNVSHAIIGTIHATDDDVGRNGQVYFYLDQGHSIPGQFYMDPISGTLATSMALPTQPDRYTMYVTARDQGMEIQLQSAVEVIVHVQCDRSGLSPRYGPPVRPQSSVSNNMPPQFTAPLYEFIVGTCGQRGIPVGSVQAKDPNVGLLGQLIYTVKDRNMAINPATGLITLNVPVFRSQPPITFQIIVTDGGGLSAVVNATISVRCQQRMPVIPAYGLLPPMMLSPTPYYPNRPPTFPNSSLLFDVDCIGPYEVVGYAWARDPDEGLFGEVNYSLSGPDASLFSIAQNGDIRTAADLKQPRYTFVVVARDGGSAYSQASVTVNNYCGQALRCVPPVYTFDADERISPGTTIGRVTAIGRNIRYRIITNGADQIFSVELQTGMISSRQSMQALQSSPALSATRTANFVIRATEPRGSQESYCDISVFITVNFTVAPVFPGILGFANQSYYFTAGCVGPSSLIGVLQTTTGYPRAVYDITGPQAAMFAINSATGELRTRYRLVEGGSQLYSFTAGLSALGIVRAQVPVTVQVTCRPLKCPTSVTIQVPEDAIVGSVIGQIPTDIPKIRDATVPLSFRVIGPVNSPISIVIDPKSGEITLGQPIPPLTLSTGSSNFRLDVAVFDFYGQGCNISVNLIVSRRIRPPEFVGTPYIFTAICGRLGDIVGRVTAVWLMGGFQPAKVTYAISAGKVPRYFTIDGVSGELSTTENIPEGRYVLQIRAHDSNGLLATTNVNVNVPKCPLDCPDVLRAQINDNSPQGTGIAFIPNPSRGSSGNVTYRISPNTPEDVRNVLTVDPSSGSVVLNEAVREHGGQMMRVPIIIQSTSGQTCEIVLEVGIVRRVPPSPNCPPPRSVSLLQSAKVGTIVTDWKLSSEPGDFTYSLVATSGAGEYFEIDRSTGTVFVTKVLSSLPARTYQLMFRGSLLQDVTVFCDGRVDVTVQPVNLTLQCALTPLITTVDRNLEVYGSDRTIAIVRVGSPNGYPLQFTVLQNEATRVPLIAVGRSNGIVSLTRGITEASLMEYQYVVRAMDPYGAFCDTALVLKMPPVNQPPVFMSQPYLFSATCGPANNFIGVVQATDEDGEQLTYSVTPSEFFTIDQLGAIRTRVPIVTVIPAQTLSVMVSDSASLVATTQVGVTFDGVGCGSPPICSQPVYRFELPANAPQGLLVGTVRATDPDGDRLSYTLFGPDQKAFIINPTSGEIRTASLLTASTTSQTAFQFAVRASSAANAFCEMTIQVTFPLTSAPRFSQSTYDFSIPCGTSMRCFGRVLANARSNGGAVQYSLSSTDRIFTVVPESGEICLRQDLEQPLRPGTLSALVSARDMLTSTTATAEISVTVQPCQRALICSPPVLTSAINEVDPIGTRVQQVSATNRVGEDGLTFSIVDGNREEAFTIDSLSGVIVTNRPLDREKTRSYRLSVVAKDGSGGTCQVIVDVAIIDNNDNVPVFERSSYEFQTKCQEALAYVGTVSAVDDDIGMNAKLVYSIAPNSPVIVDPETGEIRTRLPLDSSQGGRYEVVVFASDAGSPQKTAAVDVKITTNCSDTSANLPPICPLPTSIRVRENSPPNTLVTQVTSLDPKNRPLRYSLGGPYASRFSITPSGQVLARSTIDRQTTLSPFSLSIQAVNNEGLSCTTMLTITVLNDNNDQPPQFIGPRSFAVDCAAPSDTVVGQVSAVSGNGGQNSRMEYSLSGTTEFVIDKETGQIKILRPLSAQFPTREIVVVANDLGTPRRTAQTTVQVTIRPNCPAVVVTYSPPQFLQPSYSFTINCGHIGLIGLVSTQDPDADMSKPNSVLYTLADATDTARSIFIIDVASGELRARRPVPDSPSSYQLAVLAADNSQVLPRSATVKVDIFVQCAPTTTMVYVPPTCPPPFVASVMEQRSGVLVGTVVARNPNPDSALRFSLIPSADSQPNFQIDSINANSARIALILPLDRRRQSTYIVDIKVVDAYGQSCETSVRVNVVDAASPVTYVPPLASDDSAAVHERKALMVPQSSTLHCLGLRAPGSAGQRAVLEIELEENMPVGTLIGSFEAATVQSIGMEPLGRLTYRINSGNSDGAFSIDASTGELKTAREIDRETRDVYNLTISAADPSNTHCSAAVFVRIDDVNDHAPDVVNMQPVVATVNCSTPNAFVVRLSVVDRDLGQNADVSFFLENNSGFHISNTGEVRTTVGLLRDPPARFVPVRISDHGTPTLSTTVTLTINVACPPAPTPTFHPTSFQQQYYCAGIPENSSPNTEITRVKALYPDNRSDVSYVLRSGNSNLFSVDPKSGIVRSRAVLDADNTNEDYSLVVGTLHNDRTTPDAYAVVFINILDVNDENPRFESLEYRRTVPSTVLVNSALLSVRAIDKDQTYPNNHIRGYELGGNSAMVQQHFRIDSAGELVLSEPLAAFRGQTISITVIAVDGGIPPRTGTTTVFLAVI